MAGPSQPAGHRHAGLGVRGGRDGRHQRVVDAAVPPVAIDRTGPHPGTLQGPDGPHRTGVGPTGRRHREKSAAGQ
ncbi:hypothetical protein G6F46_015801 [Rhizopus delemar]|nr:hypothetical protein G6F65_022631 [Rhizopus arrhizus]KAG1578230.1 hypothetical protein G6F46_015801 [Rhizopus delemar]